MKTILIIDDDSLVRESLQDVLELYGFRTLTASNGRVGLELAMQSQPDLILCDVQMPEMDGYTVLQTLRQTPAVQTIPFVFLTAWADRPNQRQGMELGADDYLGKPCSTQELLAALQSRLGKQQAIQAQSQAELDRLRSSIAIALPHEFRTPLSGIFTSVELLRLLLEGAEQADELLPIVETIQAAAQRLHGLVQNYLIYCKLELAIRDPEYKSRLPEEATFDPTAMIGQIATQIALLTDRQADLRLDLRNAEITFSLFDLEKVLAELLNNAFKFSPAQSSVRVTSRIVDRNFQICISNEGRGMTPAQIEALGGYMQFNRDIFEQQGIGLGLAIAQRLLQLRDGNLMITSIPDQITTVTITIPLAAA